MVRDGPLTAIDEHQLPPSSPNDVHTEFGRRTKSHEIQRSRTRRKSIKQIVMRITTGPTSAGEKVKFKTAHDSRSTPVVLPPDTLMPLDPPPGTRFEGLKSSSVPSLPSAKGASGFAHSQGEVRCSKRFKNIRKKWNAVLSTVRG